MTTARDALIEAGAKALGDAWVSGSVDTNQDLAAVVIDAVEPLIRADERARLARVGYIEPILADLRGQVEALRVMAYTRRRETWDAGVENIISMQHYGFGVACDAVLALLDGGSDE